MKRRIKLNGIVLLLAGCAAVFFPRFFIRQGSLMFDDLWEGLGVVLILGGQLLRVSARGYKSEQSYSGNHLVVTGPYSLVRNPMYLGIILIGCGVVLFVLHPWTLLIFGAGFFIRYRHLFPKEEASLLRTFGNEYEEYCMRVPRLLPRLATVFRNPIASYLPMRVSWFKREMLSISVILTLVFIIESWEEIQTHGWGYIAPGIARLDIILCSYFLLVFILARSYERTANKCAH